MGTTKKTNLAAVVLAGGKGTRMNSETPKVLHTIANKPMIFYTLEKLIDLGIEDIYVVVGFKAEEVQHTISSQFPTIHFAHQDEPRGTGDAVGSAIPEIRENIDDILVVNGDDSAFYSLKTLDQFIKSYKTSHAPLGILSLRTTTQSKLGRIIRNNDGTFLKILEHSEYEMSGLHSDEINCGAYLFDILWLKMNIHKIPLSQKGEYYLTELLNIAKNDNQSIDIFQIQESNEWVGINTQEELQGANEIMKIRSY